MEVLGWKEWGQLPDIGIDAIHMKVDTGAKTSCLHAFKLEPFEKDEQPWLRVYVHPHQDSVEEHVFEAPFMTSLKSLIPAVIRKFDT